MILGKKNPHHAEINNIKIKDVTHSSSSEISNVLNHHFKQVGLRLANVFFLLWIPALESISPLPNIYLPLMKSVYNIIQSFTGGHSI